MEVNKNFSDLPDEILENVLSYLSLKEACQTNLLAHRWRYLWFHRNVKLEFDADTILGKDGYEVLKLRTENPGAFRKERDAFISCVNACLNSLPNEVKKGSFKLCFLLDNPASHDTLLDFCVGRSLRMGVDELTLELASGWPGNIVYYGSPDIVIDENQFYKFVGNFPETANLKSLKLEFCLWVSEAAPNFRNLKELQLCMVSTDHHLMENILSYCPLLQKLIIIHCWDLTKISVVGNNSLLHLSVVHCPQLEITVNSLILEFFEYMGSINDINFVNVPKLKTIFFGSAPDEEDTIPKEFNYYNLETLTLRATNVCKVHITANLGFKNLKRLRFDLKSDEHFQDLTWIGDVMKSLYYLEDLTVSMRKPVDAQKEIGEYSSFPKNQLQNLHMVGFSGSPHELDLLKFFFQTSTRLTNVSIKPSVNYYCGGGNWIRWPTEPRWFSTRREETLQFFLKKLPLKGVKVNIFN